MTKKEPIAPLSELPCLFKSIKERLTEIQDTVIEYEITDDVKSKILEQSILAWRELKFIEEHHKGDCEE